jgi:hypothetical protein
LLRQIPERTHIAARAGFDAENPRALTVLFMIWTLSARFALGVKSTDSRNGVADADRISGAGLNAGVDPDGEREAAFSSVAGRIPRYFRRRTVL